LQLGVELSQSKRYLNVWVEKVNLYKVEVSRIGVSFHIFGKLKSGSLAMKSVLKRGTKVIVVSYLSVINVTVMSVRIQVLSKAGGI
jgi:hypothetical protein